MRMSRKAVLKSAAKRLPLGTTWIFDEVGSTTFTVEQTGYYDIELHGGGGGSGSSTFMTQQYPPAWASISGGGGGGSGEIYSNVFLTKGTSYTLVIGAGGAGGAGSGISGGQTKFGTLYTLDGGGGGGGSGTTPDDRFPGVASGSLATAGEEGVFLFAQDMNPRPAPSRAGGQGNKNNISQTYGDGGSSPATPSLPGVIPGNRGQDGAIILTLKSY